MPIKRDSREIFILFYFKETICLTRLAADGKKKKKRRSPREAREPLSLFAFHFCHVGSRVAGAHSTGKPEFKRL